MTSKNEHPIQQARREWDDGYRSYLGRTHYLMKDLQAQQAPESEQDQEQEYPDADHPTPDDGGVVMVEPDEATVYEKATSDLPDLPSVDPEFLDLLGMERKLTDAEYRVLEGFTDEDGGEVVT
jgi:hypothetical protein